MENVLEGIDKCEEDVDGRSKAQLDIQQKISDAKALAQRRETFLLSRKSMYGSTSISRGPGEGFEWGSIDGSDNDSIGDVAMASLVQLLPEHKREKESTKMREDHKTVLGADKNIDVNMNDVFHEKKGGRYAGILDGMKTEQKNEEKMEAKKAQEKRKCVIS